MKALRKVIYTKTILFLNELFCKNCFKLFLLAVKIEADECISHGRFVEKHYKEIQKNPNCLWIDV
jgi:hypothetical protein